MPTTTTNYDFNKPNVNSADDEDLWGGQLNANWDSLDAILKLIQPAGKVEPCFDATEPTGWLFLNAKTIGNASSGGTSRANADTEDLFTYLWTNLADSEAPVSTGRGASAAADYAANKTIQLPDGRGRALFGTDMGGATSGRLTTAGSSVDGTTLGASGGNQKMQQHNHAITDPGHTHTTQSSISNFSASSGSISSVSGTTNTGSSTTGISINNTGTGTSENVPPALIVNWKIKL